MQYKISLLLLLSVVTCAVAQNPTPVVDLSGPVIANSQDAVGSRVDGPTAAAGDRYYQMQVLQDEVRVLRGMLETLNYQLEQIKQRQMDDYLDIDRRISAISAANHSLDGEAAPDLTLNTEAMSVGAEDLEPTPGLSNSAVVSGTDAEVMKADYDRASSLLLKQRDIEAAAQAFKRHIVDYPASPYAANTQYWLGEIYLLQGHSELSRQAFMIVVEQYADHSKAMDARFKLGKIYHQLGNNNRAREFLQIVAQSKGGAASKARVYLDRYF